MSYRPNTQSLATPMTAILDGIETFDKAVTARIESGAFTPEHIEEICDLSVRLRSLRLELQQARQLVMGYHKELDEYSRFEISQELARRETALHAGICDYCNRSGLTKSCRFPKRHEIAKQQAERLGHKLCGKAHCQNIATHTAYGSLTYAACNEHNNEIQTLVDTEMVGTPTNYGAPD